MLDDILPPPFPGFSDEGLAFLAALADHNERDWFKPRKATYDDHLKAPLDLLVESTTRALAAAGSAFTEGRAFRIYRDVRFAKDKRPYQTHVSASFDRPGEGDPVFVYVQVQPEGSFVASGVYKPAPKWLRPVRERIAERFGAFESMLAEVEAEGVEVGPLGHTLTGMPRGFAGYKAEPSADALRWESLVAQMPLTRAEVQSPGLVDRVVALERAARPLVRFLDAAHGR